MELFCFAIAVVRICKFIKRSTEMTKDNPPTRVAVLGLGNPVLCDDAVGLHVAAEVERLLREEPLDVSVLTSTRGGFALIDLLTGFTHAMIIDSLEIPDPSPGHIRQLDLKQFSGSTRLVGGHELSVADAFELAATLNVAMPETVEIYAVEGGDMKTLTEGLTPSVAAAVAPLARRIYERADKWLRSTRISMD